MLVSYARQNSAPGEGVVIVAVTDHPLTPTLSPRGEGDAQAVDDALPGHLSASLFCLNGV